MKRTIIAAFALLGVLNAPVAAQEHTSAVEAAVEATQGYDAKGAAAEEDHGFDILHHIQDSREVELPFIGVWHLPPAGSWQAGPLDLTPTKHVVFLALTGLLVLLILIPAGRIAERAGGKGPAGKHHNIVETLVLYLRNQVVMANIGHGGEKFAPFVLTLFFFILVSNLLGLLPWGATATANVSVTAALAIMALIVIEVAGMRAQGLGYINTIIYWNKDLAPVLRVVLMLIMLPVEILGKLAKPFALTIRLFANMTAGHILLLAIISLVFVFGSVTLAAFPVILAVSLTFLEIFAALLQAYIFALLTAVFIGLIRHAH